MTDGWLMEIGDQLLVAPHLGRISEVGIVTQHTYTCTLCATEEVFKHQDTPLTLTAKQKLAARDQKVRMQNWHQMSVRKMSTGDWESDPIVKPGWTYYNGLLCPDCVLKAIELLKLTLVPDHDGDLSEDW